MSRHDVYYTGGSTSVMLNASVFFRERILREIDHQVVELSNHLKGEIKLMAAMILNLDCLDAIEIANGVSDLAGGLP
jgi:hypothetical protein